MPAHQIAMPSEKHLRGGKAFNLKPGTLHCIGMGGGDDGAGEDVFILV